MVQIQQIWLLNERGKYFLWHVAKSLENMVISNYKNNFPPFNPKPWDGTSTTNTFIRWKGKVTIVTYG